MSSKVENGESDPVRERSIELVLWSKSSRSDASEPAASRKTNKENQLKKSE